MTQYVIIMNKFVNVVLLFIINELMYMFFITDRNEIDQIIAGKLKYSVNIKNKMRNG